MIDAFAFFQKLLARPRPDPMPTLPDPPRVSLPPVTTLTKLHYAWLDMMTWGTSGDRHIRKITAVAKCHPSLHRDWIVRMSTTNESQMGLLPPRSLLLLGVAGDSQVVTATFWLCSSPVPEVYAGTDDWGWLNDIAITDVGQVFYEGDEMRLLRDAIPARRNGVGFRP